MRPSTPDPSVPEADPSLATPDDVIVEAPTAEQALAEVHARLGANAAIVEAGKVLRGGLGGFFAREVVQLRARAGGSGPAARSPVSATPSPADATTTTAGGDTALERLLAGITSDVDAAERSFADVLRRQLGASDAAGLPDPAVLPRSAVRHAEDPLARAAESLAMPLPAVQPAPTPAAASVAPVLAALTPPPAAPVGPAPAPVGAPVWTVENLRRLGLPAAVVDAVGGAGSADDAAWVTRLAAAVAPLCRRLPDGPMILAGPCALPLADALALPVVTPGCKAPALGSFAVRGCDGEDSRAWISAGCSSRWLHVVVGGTGWRPLLFADPAAVSWVADASLPDAVQVATDLGLALGYGTAGGSGSPRPANPVDIAIAIRGLLPRR
ncbi:MAG TPA: hypothetical protein VM324_10665 [Egibacteraceae bacterium]|nr:hypothetical protein [Egibacteraceae bacterium]